MITSPKAGCQQGGCGTHQVRPQSERPDLADRRIGVGVVMTYVIYGAFFITIFSVLVDLFYAYLDPRIRPT